MRNVIKQILEKNHQVPQFKECVLQCNDKTNFVDSAYDAFCESGVEKRGINNTATRALAWENVMGNIQRQSSRHRSFVFRILRMQQVVMYI